MSKFVDAIKGFINKHFTREVTCCNCGKTGKVMFFSTLMDGNKLCAKCKNEIPYQFEFTVKETTTEEFKELFAYVMNSKNVLKPKFHASSDYSYGDFEVDPIHNLCRVNGSFVFEIKDIEDCGFEFRPEEFKEGLFSSKVKGDVYLTGLILASPRAVFGEQVIKYGAKGKAEKALLSSTITYHNPEALDEFMARFSSLWEHFQNQKLESEINNLVEERVRQALEARDAEN